MSFDMAIFLHLSLVFFCHLLLLSDSAPVLLMVVVRHTRMVNVYRSEGRNHASLFKRLPIEIFEPSVLFQLFCAFGVAESLLGVHAQALVDEKDGLLAPSSR